MTGNCSHAEETGSGHGRLASENKEASRSVYENKDSDAALGRRGLEGGLTGSTGTSGLIGQGMGKVKDLDFLVLSGMLLVFLTLSGVL